MSPPAPHIRLCPAMDGYSRSLIFPPLERDVPEGVVLKLGRFADRRDTPSYCLTFRSKVVSRNHAEIWFQDGCFMLKDCKSSSGTFLNNIRLSPAGVESSNFPLKDGDIVQLGVEYQGGAEDVHKCVRLKLEINRSSLLKKAKQFRNQTAKTIKALTAASEDGAKSECCICLSKMGPLQALFIAPCGHPFHYKCVKPMLSMCEVYFLCPLCRHYADLDASLSLDDLSDWLDDEDIEIPNKNNEIGNPSEAQATTSTDGVLAPSVAGAAESNLNHLSIKDEREGVSEEGQNQMADLAIVTSDIIAITPVTSQPSALQEGIEESEGTPTAHCSGMHEHLRAQVFSQELGSSQPSNDSLDTSNRCQYGVTMKSENSGNEGTSSVPLCIN